MDIALIGPTPWELDQLNMLGMTSHHFHLRAADDLTDFAFDESFVTNEPLMKPRAFRKHQLPLLDAEVDILQFFNPWYAVNAFRAERPKLLSLHDTDFARAVEEEQPFRLFKAWFVEQAAINLADYVVTDAQAKINPYYVLTDASILHPDRQNGIDYPTIYKFLGPGDTED